MLYQLSYTPKPIAPRPTRRDSTDPLLDDFGDDAGADGSAAFFFVVDQSLSYGVRLLFGLGQ